MAGICEAITVSIFTLAQYFCIASRQRDNVLVMLPIRNRGSSGSFLQCCFRWFSRRREDEEKEGLLIRDSLLEREARETEPPTVVNGHQLRERRDVDHEPREHVRRVARVGFQSRVEVRVYTFSRKTAYYSTPT